MGTTSQGVISLQKSQILAYTFWALHQGGQACLIPFLSLYIRQLGMDGAQTGLIIGASFACCLVALPLWKWVSTKLGQYRGVIMGCLVGSIVFNLLLVAVPPILPDYAEMYCSGGRLENTSWWLNFASKINKGNLLNTTLINHTDKTTLISTTTPGLFDNSGGNSTLMSGYTTDMMVTTPDDSNDRRSLTSVGISTVADDLRRNIPERQTESNSPQSNQELSESKFSKELRKILNDISEISHQTSKQKHSNSHSDSHNSHHRIRKKRDLFSHAYEGISTQLWAWKDQMRSLQHKTVLVTIIVLILASVFGCAVPLLFDEAWFEFLDDIDEVELYGRHHLWGGVGKAITPIIAASIVDSTSCIMGNGKNHIVIHVYLMAFFTFWSLVIAYFQPVYCKLSTHHAKLMKGVKLLFTDVHCSMLALTVLIVGTLSSTMHLFMFWVAEDLSSGEVPMGLALAIGGTTHLIMLQSGRTLVERYSPAKVAVLGLAGLIAQLICVSYLWSPWMLIVSEGLTGISQGAVWQAVQHHPDFALHLSNTERSVFLILHISHQGMALPLGCFVSGVVYDHFGPSTLFQSAALVAFLWCGIFSLVQWLVPKQKRLQYSELIGGSDDDHNSNRESYDPDDWLEAALKSP